MIPDIHQRPMRSEAESVSLIQDASAGWLCLRYGSCNKKLLSQYGVIGISKIANLKHCHALKIKECTEGILREFCCPSAAMPSSKKKRKLCSMKFLSLYHVVVFGNAASASLLLSILIFFICIKDAIPEDVSHTMQFGGMPHCRCCS